MVSKESVFYNDIEREKLIEEIGLYIVENNSTVRKTAERFGISKSTVHKDLTVYLKKINFALFKEAEKVLQKNKSERHIRGGLATKLKYLNSNRDGNSKYEANKNSAFRWRIEEDEI